MSKFTFLVALVVAFCGIIHTHATTDVEEAWQEYQVNHFRVGRCSKYLSSQSLMNEFLIQYNDKIERKIFRWEFKPKLNMGCANPISRGST
jgi:hypothetical protein